MNVPKASRTAAWGQPSHMPGPSSARVIAIRNRAAAAVFRHREPWSGLPSHDLIPSAARISLRLHELLSPSDLSVESPHWLRLHLLVLCIEPLACSLDQQTHAMQLRSRCNRNQPRRPSALPASLHSTQYTGRPVRFLDGTKLRTVSTMYVTAAASQPPTLRNTIRKYTSRRQSRSCFWRTERAVQPVTTNVPSTPYGVRCAILIGLPLAASTGTRGPGGLCCGCVPVASVLVPMPRLRLRPWPCSTM